MPSVCENTPIKSMPVGQPFWEGIRRVLTEGNRSNRKSPVVPRFKPTCSHMRDHATELLGAAYGIRVAYMGVPRLQFTLPNLFTPHMVSYLACPSINPYRRPWNTRKLWGHTRIAVTGCHCLYYYFIDNFLVSRVTPNRSISLRHDVRGYQVVTVTGRGIFLGIRGIERVWCLKREREPPCAAGGASAIGIVRQKQGAL